jgi:hypothetical protein
MSGVGVGGAGEGPVHPNARLLQAFYQAQAAFTPLATTPRACAAC